MVFSTEMGNLRSNLLLVLVAALACLAFNVEAAPAKGIRGIDVSRFQEVIDWPLVGETKLRFAFVAASRGSGDDCLVAPTRCGADEFYDSNYHGAKDAGLRVGAYHRAFASGATPEAAKLDAREEANLFIEQVGKVRSRDLRPALDVETPFADMTEESLRAWIRAWMARVEAKFGQETIVYTNASSWSATGNTTAFAEAGNPLWVANFDVPSPIVPAADWGGLGWAVWQYTSTGHVRGIEGAVDKDRLSKGFRRIKSD